MQDQTSTNQRVVIFRRNRGKPEICREIASNRFHRASNEDIKVAIAHGFGQTYANIYMYLFGFERECERYIIEFAGNFKCFNLSA